MLEQGYCSLFVEHVFGPLVIHDLLRHQLPRRTKLNSVFDLLIIWSVFYPLSFPFLTFTRQIRNDRGCHKEICGLEVDCPTRPTPCDWRGKLVKIEVLNSTIADT